MSDAEEPPGPEPEGLSEKELDEMAYSTSLPPSYRLDNEDYYNPFPAFNADDPGETFIKEPGLTSRAPPIPDELYQQHNLDPLGCLRTGLDSKELKIHKLKFCEAAPDLIRSIVHALAELSTDENEDEEVRDRAGDQLEFSAHALGTDLSKNEKRLKTLHTLTKALTAQLDKSAREHIEEAKRVAREEHLWPLMLGNRKRQKEGAADFLKELELASRHNARALNLETAVNDYAAQLVDYVDRLRRIEVLEKSNTQIRAVPLMPVPDKLFARIQAMEPLNESNVDTWFNVAWDVLLHFTGGEPETFYVLEELGEYQVRAAKDLAQRPRSVETDERSARSGIKRRIKQSVRTLAKNL